MTYNNINWHMDKGYYVNRKYGSLHRYIYTQHNGTIPEGYVVHHDNKDKTDNTPKNLIAMTRGEHQKLHNIGNTYSLGTKQPHSNEHKRKLSEAFKGELNPNAKLTELDVKWIRMWLSLGYTGKSIAEAFNVSRQCISHIKTGREWSRI